MNSTDSKSKYYIDYNLNVYYCANRDFKIGVKKMVNSFFEPCSEKGEKMDRMLDDMVEIPVELMQTILKSKTQNIGIQCSDEYINWVFNYEYLIKKNINILNEEEFAMNYMTIKLILIGIPTDFAYKIANSYFSSSRRFTVQELIEVYNDFIDKKMYWIKNDILKYQKKEYAFINHILEEKIKLKSSYSFLKYREEYLNLCLDSLVIANYKFNKTSSYLIKSPKNINEQKHFIELFYKETINSIINQLISTKYRVLLQEEQFASNLVNNLYKNIETVYEILEKEEMN